MRSALRNYLPAILLFVLVLLLWEGFVYFFSVQKFILPPPSVIAEAFTSNFQRLVGIGVVDQSLQQILGNPVLGKILVLGAIILFLQWKPAGIFVTRSRSLES